MHIVITENRDKAGRIVNGQDAIVLSGRGNTIVVQFPDNQRAFVYPVSTTWRDRATSHAIPSLPPMPEPSASRKDRT